MSLTYLSLLILNNSLGPAELRILPLKYLLQLGERIALQNLMA